MPCYSETHEVSKGVLPQSAVDFKCDGNPIDTLVLSLFVGNLSSENQTCIGKPFLNLNWLQSQYNLIMTSEDPLQADNFDGNCILTVWRKKSESELQKIRDQTQGLQAAPVKVAEPEFASNAAN